MMYNIPMLSPIPGISIPLKDIQFDFIHASGPGGQNVNKLATAAQLRFDVRNSAAIPTEIKTRLVHLAGSRMTSAGILVILAKRYRSQERNRLDALQRFSILVERASQLPRTRRPTKPTSTARRTRLDDKKRRGAVKRLRQSTGSDEG